MLNMDPVVQVNVAIGATTVASGTFDVGAILTASAGTSTGTGTQLSATHRFESYDSLSEVLNGVTNVKPAFANTTDVYLAAAKYFGTDPAPARLVVIWYDTASETTETPITALADAINEGVEFYGLFYSPKASETAANIKTYLVGLASALNSLNRGMLFYGVTGTAASVTDADGIMKAMSTAGAKRAIGITCTSSTDDAAALMGLAMGLARSFGDNPFAMCYKSIATATVNSFTQSEVDSIKAINGNVYVARTKTRAGLENGAVAAGLRFDDILFMDKIAYEIQVALYNAIANSPTKLPQTDTTTTLFFSKITRILEKFYNTGVLNTNKWQGADIVDISNGTIIEHGYHLYADTFDHQSREDRAARKAMPITVLLCFNGSIESIVINLDIQT